MKSDSEDEAESGTRQKSGGGGYNPLPKTASSDRPLQVGDWLEGAGQHHGDPHAGAFVERKRLAVIDQQGDGFGGAPLYGGAPNEAWRRDDDRFQLPVTWRVSQFFRNAFTSSVLDNIQDERDEGMNYILTSAFVRLLNFIEENLPTTKDNSKAIEGYNYIIYCYNQRHNEQPLGFVSQPEFEDEEFEDEGVTPGLIEELKKLTSLGDISDTTRRIVAHCLHASPPLSASAFNVSGHSESPSDSAKPAVLVGLDRPYMKEFANMSADDILSQNQKQLYAPLTKVLIDWLFGQRAVGPVPTAMHAWLSASRPAQAIFVQMYDLGESRDSERYTKNNSN